MKKTIDRNIKYLFLLLFLNILIVPAHANSSFAYGADIGWVKRLQDEGVTWQNDSGEAEDPLTILQSHGINSVRLRVFVNPAPGAYWPKPENEDETTLTMLSYTDKVHVVEAARRAHSLGMRVMVDFHYSDVFADPRHQAKPKAWQGMPLKQLVEAIYNHTYEVMQTMVNHGVTPEWVQVGNEIENGMVHPEGKSHNFDNLTAMLNAGYDAVKAASPKSKVITHLSNGTDNKKTRWFFDNFLTQRAGKTDIIGLSFYPYWLGQNYRDVINHLKHNLNDLATRYNKEVMVVETGGLESTPHDTYWTILETIKAVKAVPNQKGLGVFYWEPAVHSSVLPSGYPLGATQLVTENVLQFTNAIDAFSDTQIPPDTDTGGAASIGALLTLLALWRARHTV
ncbi:glycoside hydrolase family 53 protein [Vibrio mimicus]|uniref:Arabinogalactan endo-beta-1,4-galactanase n=1 Tax=Vibrio mimicus VM603 TaxID=671074 RepID=D2YHS4_VIBMI|nr:glycosyl hydrolase 53 family protein [Vibrio mimicus]EEW05697.1 conserved hypothetical protein [Vibrio mimicus VM603]